MKRLHCYMMLHGNLSFSSIPEKHYGLVLDRCYWPMLELAAAGCPMAVEFPASTLEILKSLDPSFPEELSRLWREGACEFLGSSLSQNILPLNPFKVNQENIRQGLELYGELLGRKPSVVFLPEMTFSKGLPPLLREEGYEAMVMDWDNASEHNPYPTELRYRPAFCEAGDTFLPILWNSSMNSFKFQRYIYGRLGLKDFVEGVLEHDRSGQTRAYCLYGTDWEIFNYRPATGKTASGDIERVKMLFDTLRDKNQVALCLPSQILQVLPPEECVEIASAPVPIPSKNRDDYNVARWAVSGRDDVAVNTLCHDLYRRIHLLERLDPTAPLKPHFRNLVELWGSDYRTKTTDAKYYDFWKQFGHAEILVKNEFKRFHLKKKKDAKCLTIKNTSPYDWQDDVVTVSLHLPQGLFKCLVGLVVADEEITCQCENITYYRDGSLRTLLLICTLSLKSGETLEGRLVQRPEPHQGVSTLRINGTEITIHTPTVHFKTNARHGGDIQQLIFPRISPEPLVKYLPPVYFDTIAYSNDYFSGWSEICTDEGGLHFDTVLSKFTPDPHHYTVRVPVHFEHRFLNGMIFKRYDVYLNQDRIDLTIRFHLPDITPLYFRTAITTMNPEAFNRSEIRYSTVNGGRNPESFFLRGATVKHTRFPSKTCSATTCLGATEGWVAIHDNALGLAILTPKSRFYTVPMLEYEEIKRNFLLRVLHSLCESDDTGRILMRGHNTLRFVYLGFRNNLEEVRKIAYLVNHPPWTGSVH